MWLRKEIQPKVAVVILVAIAVGTSFLFAWLELSHHHPGSVSFLKVFGLAVEAWMAMALIAAVVAGIYFLIVASKANDPIAKRESHIKSAIAGAIVAVILQLMGPWVHLFGLAEK